MVKQESELALVLSALLMLGRLVRTMRYAFREEDFGRVLGAGAFVVLLGTLAYLGGQG